MNNPFVSIVFSAYKTERYPYILKALDTISKQTYKNFETLIVIDGNKELHSILLKGDRNNVKLLINERRGGPSAARNTGILASRGEIIAIIDDDVFVSPDWLERIIKNFDDDNVLMVGGKILPEYENGSSILPEEILWTVGCTYRGHPVKRQPVRNIISANMAFRKKLFDIIKFEKPNDKNWRMSDTLIGIKANEVRLGSVIYDPSSVAYHNVPKKRTTLAYLTERAYIEGFLKSHIHIKTNTKNIYNNEFNYFNTLLLSILKYISRINLRYAFINSVVLMSVFSGFLIGSLTQRFGRDGF